MGRGNFRRSKITNITVIIYECFKHASDWKGDRAQSLIGCATGIIGNDSRGS